MNFQEKFIAMNLLCRFILKLQNIEKENNGEIKIKELLVHQSSKTTEVYTHVSNKNLGAIKSPLDDLKL